MSELAEGLQTALGPGYRIVKELGGGGMSRVFLAEDARLGRRVVVKVLPPELAAGVSGDRFEREIQLAARLQHPHIVPLLSAGSSDNLLYYLMPFIEGESLRARLAREGELPVPEALRILLDVLDALAYAHDQQVVHRDIKPDNVLLSGKHALVTDFGVAKAVAESAGKGTLTSIGLALGTPAYMAPEQAAADPHTDHRADLYALGAMAYEMLCGRLPFDAMTAQAMVAAHMAQAPEPLTQHRSAVPPVLNQLVLRCLEKKPADRWQRADEVIPHLSAMLTPTASQPFSPAAAGEGAGRVAPSAGAHPLGAAGLYGVVAVGVLAIVFGVVRLVGLPDWVFWGATGLLVAGLPFVLLTAHQERRRAAARSSGRMTATPPSGVVPYLTWRKAWLGGAFAFAGLGLAAGAFMALRVAGVGPFATLLSAGVLKERDPLVLADFVNRTSDTALAASITEALRIDLTSSPVLRLVEGNEVAATLRRMQRDPAAGLPEAAAREVAQREGAKAVVVGEVSTLGSGYVLAARLVSAADSSTLLAERETAASIAGLLPAVERLSRKLREHIGESLRTVRAGQPLEQVTTSSLAALRAYSEGTRLFDQGLQGPALKRYSQAATLDSSFGMAWRGVAVVLSNTGGDREGMLDALRRAYRLRDRMPPLEAAHATAYYYLKALDDLPQAAAAYERLLGTWPDDFIALNNLGLVYTRQGRPGDAIREYRHAVEVRPGNTVPNTNLAGALVEEGEIAAAESSLARWGAHAPGNAARLRSAAGLAAQEGRYDRAMLYADSAIAVGAAFTEAPGQRNQALMIRAQIEAQWGRLRGAERDAGQAAAGMERNGNIPGYIAVTSSVALNEALLLGRTNDALGRMEGALRRHPLDSLPPPSRPYGVLVYSYAALGRLDRAQALADEYQRVVSAGDRGRAGGNLGMARLALARGDGRAALEGFRRVEQLSECGFCTRFEQGQAFERLGTPDSAIAAYEALANGRSIFALSRDSYLGPALRRLGELYEAKGDREKALLYYGRFVDLWQDADPELQPLVREVKQRMARLAGEGGPR